MASATARKHAGNTPRCRLVCTRVKPPQGMPTWDLAQTWRGCQVSRSGCYSLIVDLAWLSGVQVPHLVLPGFIDHCEYLILN